MSAESTTTAGSRTYGGLLTINWTPSTTQTGVNVTIVAQGQTMFIHNFAPGDTQAAVKFDDGQGTSAVGDLTVTFSTDPGNNEIGTDGLKWEVHSDGGNIAGLIGTW